MKLKHLILFIAFFKYADVFAQTENDTFYSNKKEGYTHFFYDEQYYLVDKNCKFRHYTRVAKHIKEGNVFDGFFTDYYNNNKIALSGTYAKGIKNGIFKNYYYNGNLKFEVSFVNDKPNGIAKYFYDNGTPWMVINFTNSVPIITDYWNPFGIKKVSESKGSFEYQDWVWGFNDAGFNSVIYQGRLKDGRPTGNWSIALNYPNSPEEIIAWENFQNGQFIDSYNFNSPYYPKKASNLKFYPSFVDDRSQKFISKNCGIDENQDYTNYLENFMNRNFDFSIISGTGNIIPFICEVNISANGRPLSIDILQGETVRTNNFVQAVLGLVPYWIPSFINGKTISDKLTITFSLDNTKPEKRFENFKISRQEESKN